MGWGSDIDVTPALALGKQLNIHASLSTSLFLGYRRLSKNEGSLLEPHVASHIAVLGSKLCFSWGGSLG